MLSSKKYGPRGYLPAVCLLLMAGSASGQQSELLLARPDPVIEAIVNTPRDEPKDFARTLFALIDLGAIEQAKPILADLIGQQLDERALAALVGEFGSAPFLKLANHPALGPEARDFSSRSMAAAAAQSRSPERLASILQRLTSKNTRQQTSALVDLRTTGRAGVELLLSELPKGEKERQNRLRQAVVQMAPLSTPLLLGALGARGEQSQALATQAAIALGELGEHQAVPFLAVLATREPPASTLREAATWSFEQITDRPFSFESFEQITSRGIEQYLAGGPPFPPDAAGNVPLAVWDPQTKQIRSARMRATQVGVVLAARLAAGQTAILGDRPDLVRQALVLTLESQAILKRAGLPMAAGDLVANASPDRLNNALSAAMKANHSGAAAQLCDALAATNDIGVLSTTRGQLSPVAEALQAAHPAVRFAALRAVMKLNPPGPFAGSSRVLRALEYFASSDGRQVAVIATPNTRRSASIGGLLNGAGAKALITNNGGEAIQLAATGADVSVVFVDMAIINPYVRETVFRLRRQPASAGVPIVLTAGAGRLSEAEKIAREHSSVIAMPRPHTAQDAASLAQQAIATLPPDWPNANDRATYASQASLWMAKLRTEGPAFYGLPMIKASSKQDSTTTTLPAPP